MKYFTRNIILLLAIIFSGDVFAQSIKDTTENSQTNSFVPWKPIKDNNILWAKRVWRILDLNDTSNAPLRKDASVLSNASFPDVLLTGVKTDAIKPFADKTLTEVLSKTKLDSVIKCRLEIPCSYPQQITYYGIKEDWIFDKGQQLMVVHIIAIAPLTFDNGKYTPLFWISYADNRLYFSKYELQSPNKKINGFTWDEFFESRSFSSKITRIEELPLPNLKKNRRVKESDIEGDPVPNIWPED